MLPSLLPLSAILLAPFSAAPSMNDPSPALRTPFPASTGAPFVPGSAAYSGGELPYQLLSPAEVKEGERYPLILFLHGAGERGNDNEMQLKHFPERMLTEERRAKYPCYILAPQCPKGERWSADRWGARESRPMQNAPTPQMDGAIAALMEVVAAHPVDLDRVYLTGLSMGGYGTFDLATRHPDWFAAVAPVCGGGDERQVARLAGLPISVWHGDADGAVPVERSRKMVAGLRELGEEPQYHELPGVGHDAWNQAYGDDGCLDWMFAKRRDPSRRLAAAVRLLAEAIEPDEKIAFLGDSITQSGAGRGGYVTLIGEALAELRPEVTIIPAGISGHKVPNLLAREERDVRAKGATLVYVYIGINDVWHSTSGKGTPIEEYSTGLAELMRRLRDVHGAAVALATPSVIGEMPTGTNELDAMLDEYAAVSRRVAAGVEALSDLRVAFVDHLRLFNPKGEKRGTLTTDGVHLNEAGNVFVAIEAAQALRRAAIARESLAAKRR